MSSIRLGVSWPKECRDKAKKERRLLVAVALSDPNSGSGMSIKTSVPAEAAPKINKLVKKLTDAIREANNPDKD